MLNVNEIKRNAKNIVKKYSDAQVKVREATSNDPWGPSSTIMAEIADLTYNVVAFSEIMQMIWKRLNDHGKNWRHVFKSLVLLEYLIKTGTDKVAQQCIENIFAIQTLKDFQYIEDNKDHGQSIREKSKKLVALLKDDERLKAERSRALKAKSRLIEAVSSSGKSVFNYMSSKSSNGSGDMANSSRSGSMLESGSNNNSTSFPSFADGDGNNALGSDIDSARPHTLTEEETQLQIALALSKEEAERQEKTRKNDELRLKLALDVSKKTSGSLGSGSNDFMDDFTGSSSSMASGQQQNQQQQQQQQQHQPSSSKPNKQTSNIDDLLGLSFTPSATTTTSHQPQQLTSLLKTPFSTSSIPTMPEPLNDPWSVDPWETPATSSALPIQPQPSLSSQVITPQQPALSKNPFAD